MAREPNDSTRGGPHELVVAANPFAGLSTEARVERAATDIRSEWGRAVGAFLVIGRTLVDACHDGDEESALADAADDNEVFDRITRSLSTMKGGPSRKTLSNARRVVAASKEVRGHFWDVVPYGHKEILILLAHEPPKMLEGAQRAVEFGWTLGQMQDWVDTERAKLGTPKKTRARGLPATRTAFTGLAEAAKPASLDRITTDYEKLDAKGRKKVRDELAAAEKALKAVRQRLAAADR